LARATTHRAKPKAHCVSECVDSVSRGTTRILECAHCAAREASCAEDGDARARARVWWSDLGNGARASAMFTATARTPTPCHNDGGRMNAQLRRRLEMAGRVREFLRAHKTDGVGEGLGLAKLEELVQRAEVLASQQRAGLVATRSTSKHRKTLRRALQSKL